LTPLDVSKAELGKPSGMLVLYTSQLQPLEAVQLGMSADVAFCCCVVCMVSTGPSGAGESGNKYEAALYGALCGDVRAMLPACDSWEDEAWAYCRCGVVIWTRN
jgi:hypothetical protein